MEKKYTYFCFDIGPVVTELYNMLYVCVACVFLYFFVHFSRLLFRMYMYGRGCAFFLFIFSNVVHTGEDVHFSCFPFLKRSGTLRNSRSKRRVLSLSLFFHFFSLSAPLFSWAWPIFQNRNCIFHPAPAISRARESPSTLSPSPGLPPPSPSQPFAACFHLRRCRCFCGNVAREASIHIHAE